MVTLARRVPPFQLTPGHDRDPAPARAPRVLRAGGRGAMALLVTLSAGLLQAGLIALPGRGKIVVARLYWAAVCRCLGLRVRVLGVPARRNRGRAVVFACNHSSWLDIPALGGRLEACFIAKEEVARWPVIRTVAWLGRTVFVSRRASDTRDERDSMRARLDGGDNLILFPEGTSSDGSRVLPFRSAFFSIAEGDAEGERRPLIQPVSIVFDRLDGLPMGRATRPVCAWYGGMALGSHYWQLARFRRMQATIWLHQPVDPARFASRKALAQAVWRTVAAGADRLRQNRPVSLDRQTGESGRLVGK